MVPWRATEDGFVTQDNLDWYRRFAKGRPAALVVEATGIRDIPSGPLLRIGHDRFLPGLKQLVETVREASDGHTKLFIQIIDFLAVKRRPEQGEILSAVPAITEPSSRTLVGTDWLLDIGTTPMNKRVRELLAQAPKRTHRRSVLDDRELEALRFGYRERVTDTHLPHIKELPQVLPRIFADAARRAREAGFDGVELHYAHAYTMAGFLSALKRSRVMAMAARVKIACGCRWKSIAPFVKAVGDDYVVGVRFLADEVIAGGNRIDDASYFGVEFAESRLRLSFALERRQV